MEEIRVEMRKDLKKYIIWADQQVKRHFPSGREYHVLFGY